MSSLDEEQSKLKTVKITTAIYFTVFSTFGWICFFAFTSHLNYDTGYLLFFSLAFLWLILSQFSAYRLVGRKHYGGFFVVVTTRSVFFSKQHDMSFSKPLVCGHRMLDFPILMSLHPKWNLPSPPKNFDRVKMFVIFWETITKLF